MTPLARVQFQVPMPIIGYGVTGIRTRHFFKPVLSTFKKLVKAKSGKGTGPFPQHRTTLTNLPITVDLNEVALN